MPRRRWARSELDARMYGAPQPASYAVRRVSQVVPVAATFEDGPYTLDSGDKLRIVVFGQDALSNNYTVDAQGAVSLPLVGAVEARGLTTAQLGGAIAGRLKSGYVRDPSVAVEIETYRPFFVLGEVTFPGQYPYVPNMTVENAIAIAGGFTPRASKRQGHHHPQGAGRADPHRAAAALSDPSRRHRRNLRTLVLISPSLVLRWSLDLRGGAHARCPFHRPAARHGLRFVAGARRRQISDPSDQVRRRLPGRRPERHHRPHLLRMAANRISASLAWSRTRPARAA